MTSFAALVVVSSPPKFTVLGKTLCEACWCRHGETPQGVEVLSHCPTVTDSIVAWKKQQSTDSNQCVHLEVLAGTLPQPLWQSPPTSMLSLGRQG